MKNEAIRTTTSAAKEMAALIRGHGVGQRIPESTILKTLIAMLTGEAKTATDALALLVAAQRLMALPLATVPPVEESQDGLALHLTHELIIKAIGALESATGETCATFNGEAPAIN